MIFITERPLCGVKLPYRLSAKETALEMLSKKSKIEQVGKSYENSILAASVRHV
jgi:hypothetical protein